MNSEQAVAAVEDAYETILTANLEEPQVRHDDIRAVLMELSRRLVALTGGQEIIALSHNFESSAVALRGQLLAFTSFAWIEAVVDTDTSQRINIWSYSRSRFKAVSLQSVDSPDARRPGPWPAKVRMTVTLDSDRSFTVPLGDHPSEKTELAFAGLLADLLGGFPHAVGRAAG